LDIRLDAWGFEYALARFLQQAQSSGVFEPAASPSSHTLVLATMQQLQKSGLLQKLPSLMSATAAGLMAAQAGVPEECLSDANRALMRQMKLGSDAASVSRTFRVGASRPLAAGHVPAAAVSTSTRPAGQRCTQLCIKQSCGGNG
jgi:hypothetical protein